jgi:hypothetical protein
MRVQGACGEPMTVGTVRGAREVRLPRVLVIPKARRARTQH